MIIDLPSRFITSWTMGRATALPKRGCFVVEDPEAGPKFWAYWTRGASRREVRAAIAEAFGKDRRDGMSPKISGAYPYYVITWR